MYNNIYLTIFSYTKIPTFRKSLKKFKYLTPFGIYQNPNYLYIIEKFCIPNSYINIDWNQLSCNPNADYILNNKNNNIYNIYKICSMNNNEINVNYDRLNYYIIHNIVSNPIFKNILYSENFKKYISYHYYSVWSDLARNPAAIDLLKENPDKINWFMLSENPAAIDLLKENPDKIDWYMLSKNPAAIDLLKENPDKIDMKALLSNPSIINIINKIQYLSPITKKPIDILYKISNGYLYEDPDIGGKQYLYMEIYKNPSLVKYFKQNTKYISNNMYNYISTNKNIFSFKSLFLK
jgi:hypothetical protein